jgi:serine/threonine-protein kinase
MNPSASTKVGNGTTVNVTLSLGKITVSDFKGKSLSDLQAWVNEVNKLGANLKVSSTQAYSDTTTSGLIITQTPSSGDINPGSEIKASISKGKGIVVDTYKGTTNTTVQTGLKLTKVEVYSDSPSGTVVDQNPSAGSTVDNNTTITLTVSIGKPTVSNFASQTLASLQSQINTLNAKGAKLTLSKAPDEYSTSVSKGNLISNTNGQVSIGSTISYTVSKGASITINNFVGGTTLTQSGLNITVTYQFSDTVANGVVISQSKTAGSIVDSGTSMSLVVSKGAEPKIVVPDLAPIVSSSTGVEDSKTKLRDYFNKIGATNYSFVVGSYGIGIGAINDQTPPGGTSIKPNEPIVVYISNN